MRTRYHFILPALAALFLALAPAHTSPKLLADEDAPPPATVPELVNNPTMATFDEGQEEPDTPFNVRVDTHNKYDKPEYGSFPLLPANHVDTRTTIVFDQTAQGRFDEVSINANITVAEGGEGFGIALMDTRIFGKTGRIRGADQWHEPNLEGSFAVGFDTRNPISQDIFNEHGNFYGRPQREVSLHWDGHEIANRLSPVEFRRGIEESLPYEVLIHYEVGGARVSVSIDAVPVYENYFIPLMRSYPSRLALGANAGSTWGLVTLENVRADWSRPSGPEITPLHVRCFDQQLTYRGSDRHRKECDLPELTGIARIIMTVDLAAPPGGSDPWDLKAGVYVFDGEEKFEVLRFITPYGVPFRWRADVTPLIPLLRGRRSLELHVGSSAARSDDPARQKGWLASIDLDYFAAEAEEEPFLVEKLWSGEFEYGFAEKPLDEYVTPVSRKAPKGASSALFRVTVTGHGMSPNSDNAAEFLKRGRTVTINGHAHRAMLWNDGNYLNPCRPQGGTWKFDRAGWAPGSIVLPWDIPITDLSEGSAIEIRYTPDEYINHNRGKTWNPHHWVEGHLVYYREVQRNTNNQPDTSDTPDSSGEAK